MLGIKLNYFYWDNKLPGKWLWSNQHVVDKNENKKKTILRNRFDGHYVLSMLSIHTIIHNIARLWIGPRSRLHTLKKLTRRSVLCLGNCLVSPSAKLAMLMISASAQCTLTPNPNTKYKTSTPFSWTNCATNAWKVLSRRIRSSWTMNIVVLNTSNILAENELRAPHTQRHIHWHAHATDRRPAISALR